MSRPLPLKYVFGPLAGMGAIALAAAALQQGHDFDDSRVVEDTPRDAVPARAEVIAGNCVPTALGGQLCVTEYTTPERPDLIQMRVSGLLSSTFVHTVSLPAQGAARGSFTSAAAPQSTSPSPEAVGAFTPAADSGQLCSTYETRRGFQFDYHTVCTPKP